MLLPAEIVKHLVTALALQLGSGESSGSSSIPTPELSNLATDQLLRAPVYIYLGFVVLTHLFNLTPILKWGATFSRSSPNRRQTHILSWKNSRVRLLGDFVSFYESFVVLGIYEEYQLADQCELGLD